MGGHGLNEYSPGEFPLHYFNMVCGDDVAEERQRGMGLGLNECGAGGNRYLVNKVVCMEAIGKNGGLRHREAGLWAMYKGGEDGGIHKVPNVVGPRTWSHTGGEGGRVK